MREIAKVNFCKILVLCVMSLANRTYSTRIEKVESFLPSIINIKPEIQMRSGSARDTKTSLIDLRDFTYTIYPQACGECPNNFQIVVAIQSYIANYESRKTIRETWGKPTSCIHVVFFTGTTYDNSVMKKIAEESVEFHDIVQGNIEDTYSSLPYKHIMALKWVNEYCKSAKYVIKTDADTIVRLDRLYKMLENNTWGSNGLIAGYIEKQERVLRDKNSTMTSRIVSMREYTGSFYPPYCWGQFVIYSSDVIPRLIEESTRVPYFKIEDIYVTGILARRIQGIRHVNLVPQWYLNRASLNNLTGHDTKNSVYGPYSLTPKEIREFWDIILEAERVNNEHHQENKTVKIKSLRRFYYPYDFDQIGL